jgi:hypothetical protein
MEPYRAAFDWLDVYNGQPHKATRRIPVGDDIAAVVFEDHRTGQHDERPVEVLRCSSRPSWEDDIELSFGRRGVHLKRGSQQAWVTDLPWFSDAERAACAEHWRLEQEKQKQQRQIDIGVALTQEGKYDQHDPG